MVVLITTITVTPIIAILKQMSKLQKEKRGTPKWDGCFILEHWLPPLQLEVTARAGEHSKHSCTNIIWKHIN